MSQEKKKQVYVLLTSHTDFMSMLFRLFSWSRYTHASITTNPELAHFISFNKKGLRIEKPFRWHKLCNVPCALYRISLPEAAFCEIENAIEDYLQQSDRYRYSSLGLILCLLRIPHRINFQYFCSQFVSWILINYGGVKLQKPPSLYLPDDFGKEQELTLSFQGTLKDLANRQGESLSPDTPVSKYRHLFFRKGKFEK